MYAKALSYVLKAQICITWYQSYAAEQPESKNSIGTNLLLQALIFVKKRMWKEASVLLPSLSAGGLSHQPHASNSSLAAEQEKFRWVKNSASRTTQQQKQRTEKKI